MKFLEINLMNDVKCTITQQNDVEQIIKRSEEMERYNLFLVQQNQYCYDINSPKLIYRSNAITIKFSADILVEIDKPILKFIWKYNSTRMAKTTLKRKINLEG